MTEVRMRVEAKMVRGALLVFACGVVLGCGTSESKSDGGSESSSAVNSGNSTRGGDSTSGDSTSGGGGNGSITDTTGNASSTGGETTGGTTTTDTGTTAGSGGTGGIADDSAGGSTTSSGGTTSEFHGLRGTLDGAEVDLEEPAFISFVEEVGDNFWTQLSFGEVDGLMYLAGVGLVEEELNDLEHVVFRMPDDAPHAGVFFCAGAGSTFQPTSDGTHIVFRDLSRLGACSEFSGSDTLRANVGDDGTATGTIDSVAYERGTGNWSSGKIANMFYIAIIQLDGGMGTSTRVDFPSGRFSVRTDAYALSGDVEPVTRSDLFETVGAEPTIVCGGEGSTATGDRDAGILTFQLENAAPVPACPGEPVDGELSAFLDGGL